MENHHCSWENSLFLWPCSIAMSAITRGYPDAVPMVWMMSRKKMLVAGWIPQRRLMCSPCLDVKGWLNGILGAFFWLWDYGDFMVILSEYIYIYVSVSLSISISISPSIHLSIHPSIYLSIYLYIYIYMYAHGKCRPFLGCWTTLRWIPGSLWTCRGIFSTMAHGWLRCSIFGRWSGPGRDVRKAKLGYAKLCRV